jgi:hypothetical protein
MPPELTPLGRAFKLNGYTMAGKPTVISKGSKREGGLEVLEAFPLSVIFDTSFTSTHSPQPGTQNGNFQFPQDASLFLAGAWAPHVGSFVQVTYDTQSDHFSWDNTDIRYANSTKLFQKDLAYGITLNNNPTVEDLWNSTPAWGFPPISSSAAPSPTAAAMVNGTLGQDVAGVGGYAMWNNHLYLAATIYRSEHIGAAQPIDGVDFPINIRGVAPYWRAAWQETSKNNNLMVGNTIGLFLNWEATSFRSEARTSVKILRFLRLSPIQVRPSSNTTSTLFRPTWNITLATNYRERSDFSTSTGHPIRFCIPRTPCQAARTETREATDTSPMFLGGRYRTSDSRFSTPAMRVSMARAQTTMARVATQAQTTQSIYSRGLSSELQRGQSMFLRS